MLKFSYKSVLLKTDREQIYKHTRKTNIHAEYVLPQRTIVIPLMCNAAKATVVPGGKGTDQFGCRQQYNNSRSVGIVFSMS